MSRSAQKSHVCHTPSLRRSVGVKLRQKMLEITRYAQIFVENYLPILPPSGVGVEWGCQKTFDRN